MKGRSLSTRRLTGHMSRVGRAALAVLALVVSASDTRGQAAPAGSGFEVVPQAEARLLALDYGWPLRVETEHGVIELQAVVNGVPKYFTTHNKDAADTISTDECLPGGTSGLGLTGTGVTLGIWDGGGVRTTHQEFQGRVTQVDSPSELNWHSTHVAGTLVAAGVFPGGGGYPAGQSKGMSPAAQLLAYEWNNDTVEMTAAAANGLRVSNHSYGLISGWYYDTGYSVWFWYGDVTVSTVEDNWFGLYTVYSQEYDAIAHAYPYYLICKSAGNDRTDTGPGAGGGHYYYNPQTHRWQWSTATRNPDGPYDSIGTEGIAKNILTVAAVDDVFGGYHGADGVVMSSFSSWGPADDGRIKPDIAANGIALVSTYSASDYSYAIASGTSMSAPNASGSLGLLIQHWRQTRPGLGDLRSATLKALVIHTADEAGAALGPDYEFGWGLMNTLRAAQTISASATQPLAISERVLSNGGTYTLNFFGDGGKELRVTLCWTDPPGNPPGNLLDPPTPMLVNDLDLRVEDAAEGVTYLPWTLNPAVPNAPATTGDNARDNVEQIVIPYPGAHPYTLRVSHKGTLTGGSQAYSMILSERPKCRGQERAKLLAGDGAPRDWFGYAVAADGNQAVMGAPRADGLFADSGAAYVYRVVGAAWLPETKLTPADEVFAGEFGSAVAMSNDVVLVGAPRSGHLGTDAGAAYVFRRVGANWVEEAVLLPADGSAGDQFGGSVALWGNTAVVGAGYDDDQGTNAGAAYVFQHDGEQWVERQKLVAPDGAAYDRFGTVAASNDAILVGAAMDDDAGSASGSAYVFRFNGVSWVLEQKLVPAGLAAWDQFGCAVSVADGVALIGALGDDAKGADAGAAHVFRFNGVQWVLEDKFGPGANAAGAHFGASVAISGNTALVGSLGDGEYGTQAGAVGAFLHDGTKWLDQVKLLASDGVAYERFGAVAVSGDLVAVGAYLDFENGFWSGSGYGFRGLADCNGNATLDICDLAEGTSPDDDDDGIPDECHVALPGDLDDDGDVDIDDFVLLEACWSGPGVGSNPPGCPSAQFEAADFDGDNDVDLADFTLFVELYTGPVGL